MESAERVRREAQTYRWFDLLALGTSLKKAVIGENSVKNNSNLA